MGGIGQRRGQIHHRLLGQAVIVAPPASFSWSEARSRPRGLCSEKYQKATTWSLHLESKSPTGPMQGQRRFADCEEGAHLNPEPLNAVGLQGAPLKQAHVMCIAQWCPASHAQGVWGFEAGAAACRSNGWGLGIVVPVFHQFAAARSEIWHRRGLTRMVHKMH